MSYKLRCTYDEVSYAVVMFFFYGLPLRNTVTGRDKSDSISKTTFTFSFSFVTSCKIPLSTVCYEFHKYGLVKEVKELTVKQYKYLYFQSRQQGTSNNHHTKESTTCGTRHYSGRVQNKSAPNKVGP